MEYHHCPPRILKSPNPQLQPPRIVSATSSFMSSPQAFGLGLGVPPAIALATEMSRPTTPAFSQQRVMSEARANELHREMLGVWAFPQSIHGDGYKIPDSRRQSEFIRHLEQSVESPNSSGEEPMTEMVRPNLRHRRHLKKLKLFWSQRGIAQDRNTASKQSNLASINGPCETCYSHRVKCHGDRAICGVRRKSSLRGLLRWKGKLQNDFTDSDSDSGPALVSTPTPATRPQLKRRMQEEMDNTPNPNTYSTPERLIKKARAGLYARARTPAPAQRQTPPVNGRKSSMMKIESSTLENTRAEYSHRRFLSAKKSGANSSDDEMPIDKTPIQHGQPWRPVHDHSSTTTTVPKEPKVHLDVNGYEADLGSSLSGTPSRSVTPASVRSRASDIIMSSSLLRRRASEQQEQQPVSHGIGNHADPSEAKVRIASVANVSPTKQAYANAIMDHSDKARRVVSERLFRQTLEETAAFQAGAPAMSRGNTDQTDSTVSNLATPADDDYMGTKVGYSPEYNSADAIGSFGYFPGDRDGVMNSIEWPHMRAPQDAPQSAPRSLDPKNDADATGSFGYFPLEGGDVTGFEWPQMSAFQNVPQNGSSSLDLKHVDEAITFLESGEMKNYVPGSNPPAPLPNWDDCSEAAIQSRVEQSMDMLWAMDLFPENYQSQGETSKNLF